MLTITRDESQPLVESIVSDVTFNSVPSEVSFSDAELREIRNCQLLPKGVVTENLDELFTVLRQLKPDLKLFWKWKNFHIKRPNGELLRLRLLRENSTQYTLQMFEVDEQGLPIPRPIPPEDSQNPGNETIQKYLSQGEIIFQQSSLTYESQGVVLDVEEKNGHISILHWRQGQKDFGCFSEGEKIDCKCLSK